MDKLYIFDGHSLIFRMYYAFAARPMINSKGVDTSILYGFTKYLLEKLTKDAPTHAAVAFDPPGGTFRNQMYPLYKANRKETPQLVIDALEPLTQICKSLGLPVLMVPGFEADDVVGTVAKRFAGKYLQVYMVTPDKDYGQLVDKSIYQLKPGKGSVEDEVLGPEEICDKYGINTTSQVIDMLTICGDASDNVPGVKGVGEVGAAKLIAKYGSVENIYANLEELTPRQRDMFLEAKDHIELSQNLVTIKTDVPVSVSLEEMKVATAYSPLATELFDKYEFKSLKKYLAGKAPDVEAAPEIHSEPAILYYETVPAAEFKTICTDAGFVALSFMDDGEGKPVIRAASLRNNVACVCLEAPSEELLKGDLLKYGYGLKKLSNLMAPVPLGGKLCDIELMHYLINPEEEHSARALASSILNTIITDRKEETPSLFEDIMAAQERDLRRQAALSVYLGPVIEKLLKRNGLDYLYDNMEEPLSKVLSRMERTGVKVDLGVLKEFTQGLREEIAVREAAIREMAGEPNLNVSSPKQVGDVLFDKLNLDPRMKKTSAGSYSTDEQTLSEIYDRHPIIEEILEFRAAKKLLSTYIDPLPGYISQADGRIHTTFNQALTATGRLSSSNPNLQNIPIRTERGMQIRKAFVPGTPDGVILSADYSQIELRIMAHLSEDPHMVAAFCAGEDIHSATAAKIYGVAVSAVTPEQRRVAKTANFGIIYGISSFGLAQRLHISRTEAKGIIDDYFAAFPRVRDFIESCKEGARKDGYVQTMFGRRRYLPLINSSNKNMRELSERNAVNAPIQGTAADIIKLSMISTDARMTAQGLGSRMVLQIHDELLFDTLAGEKDILKALVKAEMENVITLSVPLTVECNYGKNWLEAH